MAKIKLNSILEMIIELGFKAHAGNIELWCYGYDVPISSEYYWEFCKYVNSLDCKTLLRILTVIEIGQYNESFYYEHFEGCTGKEVCTLIKNDVASRGSKLKSELVHRITSNIDIDYFLEIGFDRLRELYGGKVVECDYIYYFS